MNTSQLSLISPKEFIHILAIRWRLWFVPALVVGLGAAIYAFTYSDTWEASQALIIRNEAVNNDRGLGKFTQPEEMKTIQETLLEIALSRSVLDAALKQVGPPAAQVLHEADSQEPGAAAGLLHPLQGVLDREPFEAHATRL